VIPNTVYGPNDHFDEAAGHVIPSLMVRFHHAKEDGLSEVMLWGDGTPRREFIHCDDVADAVSFLLSHPPSSIPLNIGVGYDISIQELAYLIKEQVGYEGKIVWDATKPNGTPRKLLDSQIISQLRWKHKINLIEGLRSTYEWYKKYVCEQSKISL
jgi:GDP-L-fucose synthase